MEIDEIQEGFSNEKILIYPNPARDKVNLVLNSEITEGRILIHDMGGQLVSHMDLKWLISDKNQYNIPLGKISQGIYLITILDKFAVINKQRLIVTH